MSAYQTTCNMDTDRAGFFCPVCHVCHDVTEAEEFAAFQGEPTAEEADAMLAQAEEEEDEDHALPGYDEYDAWNEGRIMDRYEAQFGW